LLSAVIFSTAMRLLNIYRYCRGLWLIQANKPSVTADRERLIACY
jgi:hypothetical protein